MPYIEGDTSDKEGEKPKNPEKELLQHTVDTSASKERIEEFAKMLDIKEIEVVDAQFFGQGPVHRHVEYQATRMQIRDFCEKIKDEEEYQEWLNRPSKPK